MVVVTQYDRAEEALLKVTQPAYQQEYMFMRYSITVQRMNLSTC